ncbi:hypothetical protein [Longimicrobium terrae]|uniref:Lipoprotein n=1 Tax=Longimicrobium terrae TaxID=1639882 RepID=A0A841GQC0_9BACT|nr:hypothetical protein [Longimicrobium terrae]MBB4635258.1 hypothetical protein [Longimicrobium terrae]MBB6069652.1 hypothetical protein [Longimicrobium terrae]NNC31137.1 hypothetical protein [Longimicrobium terrae]
MARACSRRAFLSFAICLVLAGCGGGDGPTESAPAAKTSKLDGEWRGKVDEATLYLRLAESPNGSVVGGLGNLSVVPTFLELRVASSSYMHPDLSMVLSSPGYEPLNFRGQRVRDNVIKGKVNGSGYRDISVTLTRE